MKAVRSIGIECVALNPFSQNVPVVLRKKAPTCHVTPKTKRRSWDCPMTTSQEDICDGQRVAFVPSPSDSKVGVSANVESGILPINGLRHPPVGDTSGWYIWAGAELSSDPDFFVSMHVVHLQEVRPEIMKFLGLPPGWRFLKAGEYEDVWFDASVLRVDQ